MATLADGLPRLTGTTIALPPGPLEFEPVEWWKTRTGRTYHAAGSCEHLFRARSNAHMIKVPVLSLRLNQICKSCMSRDGQRELWLNQRLTAITMLRVQLPVSPSDRPWDDYYAYARVVSQLEEIRIDTDVALAEALDEYLAPLKEQLVIRTERALHEQPGAAMWGALAEQIKCDPVATDAAEIELGCHPDKLLTGRNSATYGSPDAWVQYIRYGHSAWVTELTVSGDFTAARDAALARMQREWAKAHILRKADPPKLAFSGAEFATPEAWIAAEHQEARRRMVFAACAAWQECYEQLAAEAANHWCVVWSRWLSGSSLSMRTFALLVATYPHHQQDGWLLLAVPEALAAFIAKLNSDTEILGPWSDTGDSNPVLLEIAMALIRDGLDKGRVLHAAELLVA